MEFDPTRQGWVPRGHCGLVGAPPLRWRGEGKGREGRAVAWCVGWRAGSLGIRGGLARVRRAQAGRFEYALAGLGNICRAPAAGSPLCHVMDAGRGDPEIANRSDADADANSKNCLFLFQLSSGSARLVLSTYVQKSEKMTTHAGKWVRFNNNFVPLEVWSRSFVLSVGQLDQGKEV